MQHVRNQLPAGVKLRKGLPASILHRLWAHADQPGVRRLFGPVDLVHGTNFVGVPTAGHCPELITIHDTGPWRSPEDVAPAVRRFPELAQRAVDRGAHVHTLSVAAGEQVARLLSLPPQRVHPVLIGYDRPVDDPRLPPLPHPSDPAPFIPVLGALQPRKRVPELVAALAPVLASNDELRLIVAGDGPEREAVENAVAELGTLAGRVDMVGYVSDPEKSWILRNALVVVSNAKAEGFGMVPLEAMSVGTPVITSDDPALVETTGGAAALVEIGNRSQLAATMIQLVDDDTLRRTLVARGLEIASGRSWSDATRELIDLYAALVDQHRADRTGR